MQVSKDVMRILRILRPNAPPSYRVCLNFLFNLTIKYPSYIGIKRIIPRHDFKAANTISHKL